MRWLLTDHICRLEEATELLNRKIPKAKKRLESVLGTFETSPKRSKVLGSASETLSSTLYNNCVFIAHHMVWL